MREKKMLEAKKYREELEKKQKEEFDKIQAQQLEELKKEDENTFYAIKDIKVKTAQIWEKQEDKYCENLLVNKIKKLVFIGFEGERK